MKQKNDILFDIFSGAYVIVPCDDWLAETETKLKKLGYGKFIQHHKHEDFSYWKTFRVNRKKVYQVGLLFYDYRKYGDLAYNVSISFECMFINVDGRIDLSVSKKITLFEFETMAKAFYNSMMPYFVE